MSGSQQLLLAAVQQAVATDPDFEYTTLLLPGNGTNGAQNNTFLDSSTNAFSITRNGNTTQGTFSPFSQTGWGNYFDGTGDYLSVPNNAAFSFGSDAFTIEMWIYKTKSTTAGTYDGLLYRDANWRLKFQESNSIIFIATSTQDVKIVDYSGFMNAWNHLAIVRSGNTISSYVNGTLNTSITETGTLNSTSPLLIAYNGDTFGGYISNLRLVKGTAVYTSNFTPSTTPLTAITNTSLLTCQSNRFIDNSTNNFAITRNGDVSVQAFSPFNPTAAWSAATYGGSGYFDGSGDYLETPSDAAFTLGSSGDFTVECWVYATATPGNYAAFMTTWSDANTGYSNRWFLGVHDSKIKWYNDAGGSAIADSSNIQLNTWLHVAAVRNSSTITLYINGTAIGTQTTSQSYTTNGTVKLGYSGTGGNYFSGYISNARVVKGTAVYTAAFTPPTAPLTAITNTSLLLNFTNAGIFDATSKNDLETVGNAQISTTQSKFGGSSVYIDGTGDYLLPNSPASNNILALGSGDFTIEFWARFSALGDRIILDGRPSSTQGAYPTILTAVTTNKLQYYANSAIQITSTNALSIDTWYHIAIVRYSGSTKMYINGVNEGSTYADSTNYLTSSNRPVIGASGYTEGSFASNFYINDLRITKGIARYTSNFTPPTTAFPLL